MIKIEKVVLPSPEQWEAIIRGMRNPKNSWERSDSGFVLGYEEYHLGPNDNKLMNDLATGGPVHAKYRRMIPVYLDITAPLYWWKEFDTYKVGTVANSCSTMHKIYEKEFTWEDFSTEHLVSGWAGKDKNGVNIALPGPADCFENIVIMLNRVRNSYLIALKTESETGLSAKDIWWQIIQLLPSSYNQKRTVMLNYEVLVGIYKWRKNHKLDEWREFCKWIESLPYSELITRDENKDVLEHPVSPLLKPDNDLPIDFGAPEGDKASYIKHLTETVGQACVDGIQAGIELTQKTPLDPDQVVAVNNAIAVLNKTLHDECGIPTEVLSNIPSEAFARTNVITTNEVKSAIQNSEDKVSVCRCKDCQRFIPLDEIKDDEEYSHIDPEPGIILGYDGFCTNTDKWVESNEYCSGSLRKENSINSDDIQLTCPHCNYRFGIHGDLKERALKALNKNDMYILPIPCWNCDGRMIIRTAYDEDYCEKIIYATKHIGDLMKECRKEN